MFQIESRRITKEVEKNTVELETYRNRIEELNILNEGGTPRHATNVGFKLCSNVVSYAWCFHLIGEKQIQSLKEQNYRHHMEEMMTKLKMEQMMKLMNNECKKVYSLEQQRNELTEVRTKRHTKHTFGRKNSYSVDSVTDFNLNVVIISSFELTFPV